MTGKIKLLNTESASGCIDAENGLRLYFDSCAVLAYDATYLAVGQLVTFDLEKGSASRAVNICVQRSRSVPHLEGKRETNAVRYMGFDQVASIRSYKFERTSLGEETEMFIVTTDIALFTKHHIGIQEGPTLCLHLLTAELANTGLGERPRFQCVFTEQNMLSHVASRPVPGARSHARRPPRNPAAAAHAV
jgi:cold shock CspA family protein